MGRLLPPLCRKKKPKKEYYLLVIAFFVGLTNIIFLTPGLSSNQVNNETTTTSIQQQTSSSSSSSSSSQKQQPQQHTKKNINATIFYNIYVPNLDHSIDIVKEQFDLIQNSYVNQQKQNHLTIYINVVGPKSIKGTIYILQLCHNVYNLNCIQLLNNKNTTRQQDGDEIDTLQAMYEYCQHQQQSQRQRQGQRSAAVTNDDDNNSNNNNDINDNVIRVGYMHNKGSFHDTPQNAKLRIPLTKAVVSQQCWDIPQQPNANNISTSTSTSSECTSCGLVFNDKPFLQMNGNFFVSRCDYIIKLIPPKNFDYYQQRLVDKAKHIFNDTFMVNEVNVNVNDTSNNYQNRNSWIGIGRYSSEHWAHSHPDVIPCDLSQRLKVWYRPKEQKFNFKMYPRPALKNRKNNQLKINFTDYYQLKGQIFKWYYLYNKTPPYNSWVWSKMDDTNNNNNNNNEWWRNRIYDEKYNGNIHNFMMEAKQYQ